MKNRLLPLILILALLLSGCSLFDGEYVRVTPLEKQTASNDVEAVSAGDYSQICSILEQMIEKGQENGLIYISDFEEETLAQTMMLAVRYISNVYPLGAYAVEEVSYDVGSNSGRTAVAVTMQYRHTPLEIKKIRRVDNQDAAKAVILGALDQCENKTVLLISEYAQTDFAQMVQDLALSNPMIVMEAPQVAEGIYGDGLSRVVELTFSYENSRDSLRQMQSQVRPVFDSAALYVSRDASDYQKYVQLYGFLMERFDYTVQTSITPAYSLLHHGVGDSRAFATVYSAMCRRAGLDCRTVTGTRQGEPWTWNIICDNGGYYHVDLLRNAAQGSFRPYVDYQMNEYVWDYSAYPVCTGGAAVPAEIAPKDE